MILQKKTHIVKIFGGWAQSNLGAATNGLTFDSYSLSIAYWFDKTVTLRSIQYVTEMASF